MPGYNSKAMSELSIYLDSSVWNYLFNDHVPDLQEQTRVLFDRLRSDRLVHVYLSDVVLQELGNAPAQRGALLADVLREIKPSRLELDLESIALAQAYVNHGILATGHLADARHVAIATVAQLDGLVSWNYRHLVNRRRREAFNGANAIMGFLAIEIIAPPDVFD